MKGRDEFLEKEFDFSKAIKNPYQTLINLYLKDCVTNKRNLELSWK